MFLVLASDSYFCHEGLTLTHLVFGILLVDNKKTTFTTHDFTIRGTLL